MEHARRRCGRSLLGPGFESPRLHLELFPYRSPAPKRPGVRVFKLRSLADHGSLVPTGKNLGRPTVEMIENRHLGDMKSTFHVG